MSKRLVVAHYYLLGVVFEFVELFEQDLQVITGFVALLLGVPPFLLKKQLLKGFDYTFKLVSLFHLLLREFCILFCLLLKLLQSC